MGIVFKAFDEKLRRTVAIKALNRRLSSHETARRRFIREARAAAGINHPNVVTIHAVEEHNECPFLVMEYVGGGSLRDYVRRSGRLEPVEVVRLSREIAAGLAAAHVQGVIHRDIKPGNIMLEEGAVRVKITDFGLARAAVDNVELTSQGLAVGTPGYMSPEQVRGEKVDLRSDLFCLGCVMYAMIAGRAPFRGEHALATARLVTEFSPPPLEKTIEGTPKLLSDVVSKLLEKDPDQRYQSATEVAEVLGRYLAVLNQARTDEMPDALCGSPVQEEVRRSPERWIVVGGIAAVMAILVALPFWLANGDPASTSDPASGRTDVSNGEPTVFPKLLTVSQSGKADAKSLAEALSRSGPGTVIRVLDSGTYTESLQITDNGRWRGLELQAIESLADPPTIRAPDGDSPALRIYGVCDVRICGFRIEAVRESAILIGGTSANVVIEDIECHQPEGEETEPGLLITAVRRTPQDPPINSHSAPSFEGS
jgi:serine/threonine protein kinase